MKENIFSRGKKLNELFKDERFLYQEFVPEKIPHREAQTDEIVFALNPIAKGRKPTNLVLLGKSGTGKTVTAKHVLRELEEFTDRAKSLYINCFEFNSRTAVLSAVTNFLGSPVPRRGLATDEIYSRFLEAVKKIHFTPVIVLDEVDQLMQGNESKILYDLLRVIEFEKKFLSVVLISNDFEFTSKLEPRVKSSLAQQTILFEPYNPMQLKDILNERVQYAFLPGKIESDAVNVAAAHSAKLGGDARIAIESLLKAGRIAEKENSLKVEVRHLKEAFKILDSAQEKKALPFMAESEKELFQIISEKKSIASGELFDYFNKKASKKLSPRQLRNLIQELQKKNLIETKTVSSGKKGKTRLISLKTKKN